MIWWFKNSKLVKIWWIIIRAVIFSGNILCDLWCSSKIDEFKEDVFKSCFKVVANWVALFRFVECEIKWDKNIKEFSSCVVNGFKNVQYSLIVWFLGLPKIMGIILIFCVISLIKFNTISILWSFSIILSSTFVNVKFFIKFIMSKLTSIVLSKNFQALWVDILIFEFSFVYENINMFFVL